MIKNEKACLIRDSNKSLRMKREGERGRKIKEIMDENFSNVGRHLKIQVLEPHRFS